MLIFRLVCSNGMVVNEARTRRTHVGRVNITDENIALYSQETLAADDHAFTLKIQDTVRAAVDEARFAQVLDKMRESKQAKLNTADIPSVVKLASSSFGITETVGQGVLQRLIEDADYTLYRLANAYWQEGEEYNENTPPLCQSVDDKIGHGNPRGLCVSCGFNALGSASNGRGKACSATRS